VAYAWAISLSQEEAASLLRRLNLAEAVVDYAVEAGAFPHAFQLAQVVAKAKLPDVHLKYAMFLEDSGRFQEAEGEFLNAGAHWWQRRLSFVAYYTMQRGHAN
jgi:intraflagellar transport protein 172